MYKGINASCQSVTSQSREFPVPGILLLFGGTSTGTGKNWSRKKVPVSVPEKILGTVTLWVGVSGKESKSGAIAAGAGVDSCMMKNLSQSGAGW